MAASGQGMKTGIGKYIIFKTIASSINVNECHKT